jgi:hypothetical protein
MLVLMMGLIAGKKSGCQTTPEVKTSPPIQGKWIQGSEVTKPPEAIKITYNLPTLTPLEKYPQLQTKNDVTISVEPVEFSYVAGYEHESKPTMVACAQPNTVRYETKVEPHVGTITPPGMQFKIRVHNKGERVLKLSDTVVLFNTDGKQIALDKEKFDKFLQGMILPQQEENFMINGAPIGSSKNEILIGLFLYDVPTKYAKSGAVDEKTNFEWYFKLKHIPMTIDAVVSYKYQTKHIPQWIACSNCNGTGVSERKAKPGEIMLFKEMTTCPACGGGGYILEKE